LIKKHTEFLRRGYARQGREMSKHDSSKKGHWVPLCGEEEETKTQGSISRVGEKEGQVRFQGGNERRKTTRRGDKDSLTEWGSDGEEKETVLGFLASSPK